MLKSFCGALLNVCVCLTENCSEPPKNIKKLSVCHPMDISEREALWTLDLGIFSFSLYFLVGKSPFLMGKSTITGWWFGT